MPGDIEFLDDGDGAGDPSPPDELGHGDRARWPRWVVAGGALALVGAVAAAILTGRGRQPSAAAATSNPPATTPSAPTPAATASFSLPVRPPVTPSPPPNPAFMQSLPVGDVQSVAVLADGDLAVLTPGVLLRIHQGTTSGAYVDIRTDVGLPLGDPSYADWTLVTDGHHLWAIARGTHAARVTPISPATMGRADSSTLVAPGRIVDAAARDGHLYLDTDVGVYDLAAGTRVIDKPPITRGGRAMVLDPDRHRLLLLDHDNGSIRSYDLTTGTTTSHDGALPFLARSLAIADGAIWAAGTTTGADPTPVLARLDPTTLHVAGRSDLSSRLDGAPSLVAGRTDLWVRGLSVSGGDELWCVNPHTGTVAQHWPAMPAEILPGGAAADSGLVGFLRLNNSCAG